MACIFICSAIVPCLAQDEVPASSRGDDERHAVKEITLDANAVQIVLNDEHRKGVDWEAIVSDFHTLQLKKEDNPIWSDKKFKISVGSLSKEDYGVLLDALDTVGQMTQTPQTSARLEVDAPQTMNMALPNKAVDVRINVLLVDSQLRGPQLHVEPMISTVLHETGSPAAVTLKAGTEIDVEDGTTIVLGSITSEQEITKTHKFPLLGNLPIVGLVFRSQGRLMQKTETIIFLTPRIKAEPRSEKNET